MTKADLNPVRGQVALLQWAKTQQAKLKEVEDHAKAAIQDVMRDADAGVLDGETVVTWESYKKRQFDQKALREDKPDIAEEYTKMIDVRTFRLTDG